MVSRFRLESASILEACTIGSPAFALRSSSEATFAHCALRALAAVARVAARADTSLSCGSAANPIRMTAARVTRRTRIRWRTMLVAPDHSERMFASRLMDLPLRRACPGELTSCMLAFLLLNLLANPGQGQPHHHRQGLLPV